MIPFLPSRQDSSSLMGSTMKFRRFALALLAAAVLLGSLGVSNVSAWGPRRGYVGPGYYPYPVAGYGWGGPAYPLYNPYVAPYPAYGILPPPFATYNMLYG